MSAVGSLSSRLEIVRDPFVREGASFAADVAAGLCARRKSLPSKYFYDELGSALFEAITVLPEYYLTRTEAEILHEWGWEMVRAIGNPVEFVELGSGSALKTRILVEEALRVQRTLRYNAVDISNQALTAAATALATAYPALTVAAYEGDYAAMLDTRQLERSGKVLMMFLGSNIGNYDPAQAGDLLRAISRSLKPGDGLLLGADLKKDARILEPAYNDPTGVTAAFNKNLLARINRELGGTFDLRDFTFVAQYHRELGCVRSYLQALRAHEVRIAALDCSVAFENAERIHTESSYKYSVEQLAALGEAAGLRLARTWTDPHEQFSVNLYTLQADVTP